MKNAFCPTLTALDDRFLPAVDVLAAPHAAAAWVAETPVTEVATTGTAESGPSGQGWIKDYAIKTVKTIAGVVDVIITKPPMPKGDPLYDAISKRINLDSLKPGDIILVSSKGFASTGIKVFTNGHYNHAAIYAGDGKVIHAVSSGVKEQSLADYVKDSKGDVSRLMVVRRPGLTADQGRDAVKFAREQIGKSYNWNGALTVMQNDKPITALVNYISDNHNRSDYYCSQLVAAAFKAIGQPVGKTIEQTPGDLADLVTKGKAESIGCLYSAGQHNGIPEVKVAPQNEVVFHGVQV